MSQAKNQKRSFNSGNKQPRHTGPKVRVVDLRQKGAHKDALIELSIEALKRFYKTVDALRLGNYKTGFNTYQHGLEIVEGYKFHRQVEATEGNKAGFEEATGTLFGLLKADAFTRLAGSKTSPGLGEYEQALFIEDEGGIAIDGTETKVTIVKFRAEGPAKKFVVSYRNTEQFTGTLIEELFALDILPQFRKELSNVVAKQNAQPVLTSHEQKRDAKPAGRPAREQQARRPMKKTAEPLHASA
jgi:hypothetical protein